MFEDIDIHKADSGKIFKEILKHGDGDQVPSAGSVKIHYTGSLLDGTKFDSSRERYGPFEFNIGEDTVIPGLEIGISSMRKGEQAVITIEPDYAYKEEGNPPIIPPNSIVKFNVEVLDFKYDDLSPEKDGSIMKIRRSEKGIGYACPQKGSLVEVHLNGKYQDKSFEDRDVIFKLGEGEDERVIKGVEIALQKFKSGEKSTVRIHSKYAFDKPTFKDFDGPPGKTVEYTIKLKRFERPQDSWSMHEDEKMQIAELLKERGNQLFKRQKYVSAINLYTKVLEYLVDKDGDPIKSGEDEDYIKLLMSANLNVSLCYIKIEDYEMAHKTALDALKIDQCNDKAHYRCGQALLGLSDNEKALEHFKKCLGINPKNSEARAQYDKIKETVQDRYEEEKLRCANMFEKFSRVNVKGKKSKKKKK